MTGSNAGKMFTVFDLVKKSLFLLGRKVKIYLCHERKSPSSKTGLQKGFTLLEVLVSLSIAAIVLVSALRLQGQSVIMNETARFYSVAPFLAQGKMAEAKFDPRRFSGSESGSFDGSFRDVTWEITIEPIEISGMEDSALPLLKATVTISSQNVTSVYVLNDYFHDISGDLF